MPDLVSFVRRTWVWWVLAVAGGIWWTQARGIVSSNDGSHVALARAFSRGETSLGPDAALTLWVDHARVGGRDHSDRPPGTAFAATPAARVGRWLDARWAERSEPRLRGARTADEARAALVYVPATDQYLTTYQVRRNEADGPTTDPVRLQGTACLMNLQAIFVGLVGLWASAKIVLRTGGSRAAAGFAMATMGLATSWGPYSTVLFGHGTAGALLAVHVWALLELGRVDAGRAGESVRWSLLAGLAGAWAVATEYALLLVVVPVTLWSGGWRHWKWGLAGVAPLVIGTGAYHWAAFGSPLSLGYDHQTNFAFARGRASTFSGRPWEGAWVLLGAGRGAGMLVQSPVSLLGLLGVLAGSLRGLAWGLGPWILLMCFHRTAWGGGTDDHRYLVPGLPLFAMGLAVLWDRAGAASGTWRVAVRVGLVSLAGISAVLTWNHFWQWRG